MATSNAYLALQEHWHRHQFDLLRRYAYREVDFVPNLLPEQAITLDSHAVLMALSNRIGIPEILRALDPNDRIASPSHQHTDPSWIKRVNMVGVNVRTIGSFWNVVKYALTLPRTQSSIHLLPIWEPGVVASLYGMASWNINPEFFSEGLYQLLPRLNTVEKQLKAVINLLHAMGKTVGMDVIPHTDRYSEMVLANPHLFEWLKRENLAITDHRDELHQDAQQAILSWLAQKGPATQHIPYPVEAPAFFAGDFPEAVRLLILFGSPQDYGKRLERRASLVDYLYQLGLEPVPATMAPPYRGLEVDPSPEAVTVDAEGRRWHEYRITQPEEMSRVFGPLTRFKFYGRKEDNQNWEIDFDQARPFVWEYFCEHYAQVQRTYGFDFMRGDMSHVQMRPGGVPSDIGEFYDPHRKVRQYIRQHSPYFAYFAESFLTPPNFMAYGDEVDHLEASLADSTLGDLQSMVVGSPEFMQNFHDYLSILHDRTTAPNFTIMTADKDDPRFDRFYLQGNEARLFIGLFLTDMPSYMGLGFEQRDPHPKPAPNEQYTKLYVFQIDQGPKATNGPYQWGKNGELFQRLLRIRQLAEQLLPIIEQQQTQWLLSPDPNAKQKIIAWTQAHAPTHLFIVNLASKKTGETTSIPLPEDLAENATARTIFSTHHPVQPSEVLPNKNGHWLVPILAPGEGLCAQLTPPAI